MPGSSSLDPLVIRNIGDIEAAKKYAVDVLDPRVWEEAARSVAAAVRDEWKAQIDADEHEVSLTHRSWHATDTEGAFLLSLTIGGRGSGDDENDSSWLACFTGACPFGSTFGFWLSQELVGVAGWKKLLRDNRELVGALRARGFRYDEDDRRRLCVPVVIDAAALAAAFESDDFEDALQPLGDAVQAISGAVADLTQLHDLARRAA